MSEPCYRGCTCACCEGVEVLTPQDTANRPGLDAIARRAGTHSSFLETMKARLSSREYPALSPLATREADDFSIALLDAWAVVADVLTFYQERIANEGYLRTATERRSVLELARLVGYQPRPGVAASTHLAFTLDEGPEVVIRAGARAQSVPAPGELPQPFETSEDLTARAAWNNLQVRLSQPQLPEKVIEDRDLYFKGIATQLKPNDPLLIKTVAAENVKPTLYRVMTVEPDAVAGRTRVKIEPWLGKTTTTTTAASPQEAAVMATPAEESVDLREVVREIFERFKARAVSEELKGTTVDQVLAKLDRQDLEEEVLPELRNRLNILTPRSTKVKPWLGDLVSELDAALVRETALPAMASAPEAFSDGSNGNNGNNEENGNNEGNGNNENNGEDGEDDDTALTADLADVLVPLSQRRSVPPRSSVHLGRDVTATFSAGSDVTAQILLATRPKLRDVLYRAWANAPVTAQPVLEVYALRLPARVFGHNAPLELKRRPSDGVITEIKEWDLKKSAPGEAFSVEATVTLVSEGTPTLRTQLKLGGFTVDDPPLGKPDRELPDELKQFVIDFPPQADERVTVTVSHEVNLPLTFRFQRRGSVVTMEDFDDNEPQVGVKNAELIKLTVTSPVTPPGSQKLKILVECFIPYTDIIFLDNSYPQVLPGSWIVLERPDSNLGNSPLVITTARQVSEQSLAAFGITGKSTRVKLKEPWLNLATDEFAVIRGTAVYAHCERLELAEKPIETALCGGSLELAGLYDGLKPGRWLIVSGERTDVVAKKEVKRPDGTKVKVEVPVPGIPAAELVMVAGVEQGAQVEEMPASGGQHATTPPPPKEPQLRPGERNHTTLVLASPLSYCYKRADVKVWANVAPATHGETKAEVLGSGDASKPLQRFQLKQSPLTYVPAATPSGVESTLRMRVNDILWHEAESLFGLEPADRVYTTRRSDAEETTVVFGDGKRGARPPTGSENVRAVYRVGLGKPGNLGTGRISQLVTRPLGVKDVINPLPATGGADPESRDQARRNTPLAVMALDRLVSVQDYTDFARTFAGIGKASAVRLSDGRSQVVHVTIAGEDDIPIDETSALFRNLEAALRQFGAPHLPVQVEVRDLSLLVLAAGVRLLPDYDWEKVSPKVRAALLDAFAFDRRDLAQDALLSQAVRAVHGVPGVDYVDVDVFDSVKGTLDKDELKKRTNLGLKNRIQARPAALEEPGGDRAIRPAELLYLSPAVPDTVILKEIKA